VNKLKKTKKVMVGITSTALLLGISGCSGSNQDKSSGSYTVDDDDLPPVPDDQNCTDWEWDLDDGVWECEDGGSRYYGHYFYGGRYFKSKPDLYKYSAYKNYKKSADFKGKSKIIHSSGGSSSKSKGSTTKGSSGFGSGSKSFGG
jgi:hypothetical protein